MSAVTQRQLPTDAVYVGGCDLLGNLFWDGTELTSIINRAESAGDTVIFGPIGLAALARESNSSAVRIVESYNVSLLFEAFAEQSAAI